MHSDLHWPSNNLESQSADSPAWGRDIWDQVSVDTRRRVQSVQRRSANAAHCNIDNKHLFICHTYHANSCK